MDPLLLLHVLTAALLVAVAGAVCAWGFARSRRLRLGGRGREDRLYTQLVAFMQTLVLAAGLLGLLLLAGDGGSPEDPLHARVYGPFMLVAVIAAWSFRTADPRWNVRVFAVVALFVAALGVRAFVTG